MSELAEMIDRLPRIRITGQAERRKIPSKKTGDLFEIAEQQALLQYRANGTGDYISQPVKLPLERDTPDWPRGEYFVAGSAFEPGAYGKLSLNRFGVELVPIPETVARLLEQDRARGAAKQAA